MKPLCYWSEASEVVDIALLCCQSGLWKTRQTTEEAKNRETPEQMNKTEQAYAKT